MSTAPRDPAILRRGGFALHYYIGLVLKVGLAAQSCILAAACAVLMLAAGLADHTLVLSGRDVGLLQHPGIWGFLTLQAVVPVVLGHSLRRLSDAKELPDAISRVIEFLKLQSAPSRIAATIFYTAGLVAFVWNTYQNQLPGIILPYDFWDSSSHPFGYWTTRVYKAYLFVWLLPYAGLVHAAVLSSALTILRERRLAGALRLQPFHPDGVGGLGYVPSLITMPIIITLLVASFPLAGAFYVHRAFELTPLMGATVVLAGAIIAYGIPILSLRTDIIALKAEAVGKLRSLEQEYYASIIEKRENEFASIRRGNEALEYFDKVSIRVEAISNYPHLHYVLKYLGIALTPSFLSFVWKAYPILSPMIIPLLRRF